jgi:subtilase family serine protease
VNQQALFLLLGTLVSLPIAAQIQPKPLVTQPVIEENLVTLSGSAPQLVGAGNDLGPVADSFPTGRMLLLLNRPPEREAALKQFLEDVHTRGSTSYHKWLTPEQFGKQFGPADADIGTVSGWLASHGLSVARVSKGRQFIEFSGTAGALRGAFHTEIHQYSVNGETRYANAAEVKIPAALAPVIKGVSTVGGFRAQPLVQVVGEGRIARGSKPEGPQWTAPNQYGTSNPYEFTVAPEDFATQYDLGPLYQAGVNGAGQTIGIINESNIDLGLVRDFQSLFGTGGTTPQVIIDGDDPGDVEGVDVEAYLDVEVSGAVAPKATVNLYIGSAGDLSDPLELAALRAVEDNQASVLSVSFGGCEGGLGNAGNQFWANLWEQAAAQGQTVLVSAGDSGPVCYPPGYPAVNGLASTSWNVAVGGTDFYYSDYASGGASATTLWNTTNDANLGSLKAPLTEQAWDDPLGFNLIPDSIQRGEYASGGGGASNCATLTINDNGDTCAGGYPKPTWQSGSGVPADGVRDIPDVSLFASNGANLSAYAICAYEGECAPGSGGNAQVFLVGGTSASAPAMAGIMALVDQKYDRQGQAGFVLYPLAQQKPAAFHDITLGGNFYYPCGNPSGATDPNCALQWDGYYGTKLYAASSGYDMATGLGSVDANVLVNSWGALSFQPTQTTMQLSNSSIVHGTPVTVTATVAPSSGTGTPTGDVAILTNAALPASQSQLFVTLKNGTGSATSVNYLPGGEYQLTGRYGGDGTFAGSTSQPVSLTVTPEGSNINFTMNTNSGTVESGGSVAYNDPFQLNIRPTGVSVGSAYPDGNATGSATFTLDSTTATVALNSAGTASWLPPALSVGNHTASASYSGDASFKPSSATAVTFSVTPSYPYRNINVIAPENVSGGSGWALNPGSSVTLWVEVGPNYGIVTGSPAPLGTVAPTGTVIVCLNTNFSVGGQPCANMPAGSYSATATLASPTGFYSQYASATVTFANLAAGDYMPEFWYNGDANWYASGEFFIDTVFVQPVALTPSSTTVLSISPSSISGTQEALLSTTVTGSGGSGAAPTGEVDYYNNGNFLVYDLLPASTGASSSVAFYIDSAELWNNGANQITAIYLGDTNYGPSTSNLVTVTANQAGLGDFTLAPQAPLVSVQSGGTGTVALNLVAVNNFSGTLTLACTPSSSQFSCSVNPASSTLNGSATATLTITATIPGAAANLAPAGGSGRRGLAGGAVALAFGVVLVIPLRRRRWLKIACLLLLLPMLLLSGCGGSGGGTHPPPVNGTPAGTYSVVVTGTANSIVHNAVVTVVVH